jgi:hypothetical protein
MPVLSGDRFRLRRDNFQRVTITGLAPSHTMGLDALVPAGTVIVALDQARGAPAFRCYPEDYDALEVHLVPEAVRSGNYSSYSLVFTESDIGELLEPMKPLSPRPPNRLPRAKPA